MQASVERGDVIILPAFETAEKLELDIGIHYAEKAVAGAWGDVSVGGRGECVS